jgi:hypothetical protein
MTQGKVEEYNYFTCPECDPQGITRLNADEFQKHLSEFHQITAKGGKRQMIRHLDAEAWFAWDYEWTIEGKTFMQHTKAARHHKFGSFNSFGGVA